MHPRYYFDDSIDTVCWKPVLNDEHTSSVVKADAKDLGAMMIVISKASPDRAAKAIIQFLNATSTHRHIKDTVKDALSNNDTNNDTNKDATQLFIEGINACIAHHTKQRGGTRTTSSETLVKYVLAACVYNIVKEDISISNSTISSTLGVSWRQVSHARSLALDLVEQSTIVTEVYSRRQLQRIP